MFTLPLFFYFKIKFTLSVSNYKICVRNVSAIEHAPTLREYGKKIFYVHCMVIKKIVLCGKTGKL